jgi:chorismate synthase
VAAGTIAEKYLKQVYGIEIVAFVSSVGKIHLPAALAPPSLTPINSDEDDDDVEDAISPDFRKLLATITREEVDKHATRCPHHETAERMTKVAPSSSTRLYYRHTHARISVSSALKKHKILSVEQLLA